jgi:hypothetical protein
MRGKTMLVVRWKITGRIMVFTNLGKLYSEYTSSILGISRSALHKKDLFEGYQNNIIEIYKFYL